MEMLHQLSVPLASGLLLTVGLLGLLMEMQTLHGIAGTIGIAALVLFFGAHVAAGDTNGFVVVLAVIGLILIVYELHITPGHTLPGVIGSAMLVASMVLAFGLPGEAIMFVAMQTVASAIVATMLLYYMLTRMFPENAWMKKITFTGAQGADYVASADQTQLRGMHGTALSFLRPAGVAQIGQSRVDVLTQGEFIPAGAPIRVTRVEGARVFVEPLQLPGDKE